VGRVQAALVSLPDEDGVGGGLGPQRSYDFIGAKREAAQAAS